MVQFKDIDLGNGDSLTLYDGKNSQDGTLIGSMVSISIDAVRSDELINTFQSTGRYIYVEYKSNGGHQDSRGIHMQYKSIAGEFFHTVSDCFLYSENLFFCKAFSSFI